MFHNVREPSFDIGDIVEHLDNQEDPGPFRIVGFSDWLSPLWSRLNRSIYYYKVVSLSLDKRGNYREYATVPECRMKLVKAA